MIFIRQVTKEGVCWFNTSPCMLLTFWEAVVGLAENQENSCERGRQLQELSTNARESPTECKYVS